MPDPDDWKRLPQVGQRRVERVQRDVRARDTTAPLLVPAGRRGNTEAGPLQPRQHPQTQVQTRLT